MATYKDALQAASLADPRAIQGQILDEFQERITGGRPIVDANNTFTFLLEAFSKVTGDAVNEVYNGFNSLYPKRAQTMSDLFKHMSDYDYQGLYAAPSNTQVVFYFDKQYLLKNAENYNDNYKLVVIPKETVFNIANYSFSLYYPINIFLNVRTQTIAVEWDNSEENSLYNLSQTTIEHRNLVYDGIDIVSIRIPVYQFVKTDYSEDTTSAAGLVKVYDYTDKFYIAKVFHFNQLDTESTPSWKEMHLTLSQDSYNPSEPTAYITIDSEMKRLRVSVPQVYFTNNKVGSKLRVEIYTTKGAMDTALSAAEINSVVATFNATSKYSAVLTKMPTMTLTAGNNKIAGGSDGLTFQELMDRVVNDTFNDKVLITPGDLNTYFKDNGFVGVRYRDGITDRIFHCYKEITDTESAIIAAASLRTKFNLNKIRNIKTIVNNNDGSYTVLPQTLYRYHPIEDYAEPYTDSEVATINSLSIVDKIRKFNKNMENNDGEIHPLTLSPFHMRLNTTGRYPVAFSYDLTKPQVTRIDFVAKNEDSNTEYPTSQISIYRIEAVHKYLGPNTNGVVRGVYELLLYVNKTEDLSTLDPADIQIRVATTNSLGDAVYLEAVAHSTITNCYVLSMETPYIISSEHQLRCTSFVDANGITQHDLPLSFTLAGQFSIRSQINVDEFVWLTKQTIDVQLGRLLHEVDNPVELAYEKIEYATYPTDEYAVYHNVVYDRDLSGALKYQVHRDPLLFTNDTPEFSVYTAEVEGIRNRLVLTFDNNVGISLSPADKRFSSYDALVAAHATATVGDFAIVKMDTDRIFVWWNNGWVPLEGLEYNGIFSVLSKIVTGMYVAASTYIDDRTVVTAISDVQRTPAPGHSYIGTVTVTLTLNKPTLLAATVTPTTVRIGIPTNPPVSLAIKHQAGEWIFPSTTPTYPVTTTVDSVNVTTTVDASAIRAGMCVYGTGIQLRTVVVSVSTVGGVTTITLSKKATADGTNVNLTIGVPEILHRTGDVVLDANGNPATVTNPRELNYLTSMIHVDAKFLISAEPEHVNYVDKISELLRSYFTTVDNTKPNLIENTELYYRPIRTLGNAKFIGRDEQIEHSLELDIAFKVYVPQGVMADDTLKQLIYNSIIKIVDEHVATGKISCVNIVKSIMERMSDNIRYIDILGINGNPLVQTLISVEDSVRPGLRQKLVQLTGNTVGIERGLTLDFVAV